MAGQLNRRAAIFGAAAGVLPAGKALAAATCGPSYCDVGITNITMTPAQQCQEWCWAASLQTIFGLFGHPLDQKYIVERLFGRLVCAPATSAQMYAAANTQWTDMKGRAFRSTAEVIWDPSVGVRRQDVAAIIVNDLANGFPLLNGAVGHATVVTAARFTGPNYNPVIESVTVRDPWPSNPNKRVLTSQEMMGTRFVARVRVF